jgi:hypothetical protein
MDFYKLKYLKYKNKYHNIKGGTREEKLKILEETLKKREEELKILDISIKTDKEAVTHIKESIKINNIELKAIQDKIDADNKQIVILNKNIAEKMLKYNIDSTVIEEQIKSLFRPELHILNEKGPIYVKPLPGFTVVHASLNTIFLIDRAYDESNAWKNQYKIKRETARLYPTYVHDPLQIERLKYDWTDTKYSNYNGTNINSFQLPYGNFHIDIRTINKDKDIEIVGTTRKIHIKLEPKPEPEPEPE